MSTSVPRVLHRQSEEFDHRNLFLQVTLGLLSLAGRLDGVLARHAPQPAGVPCDDASAQPAHPVELLVLGAIATAETLRHRLDVAVPPVPQTDAPARSNAAAVRPDVLRRWLT